MNAEPNKPVPIVEHAMEETKTVGPNFIEQPSQVEMRDRHVNENDALDRWATVVRRSWQRAMGFRAISARLQEATKELAEWKGMGNFSPISPVLKACCSAID